MEVSLSSIIVGDRYRKEMGDLAGLAASIKRLGLLHPIVVDADMRLIAGARRLAAVKLLGWENVTVTFVNNLDDALSLLLAERDENTCREGFAPSVAAAIGKALEELERPAAKARQQRHGGTAPGRSKDTQEKNSEVFSGRALDRVAEALDMSRPTYEKAKAVVEAAEEDPELAPVVEEMDRTGKVDPAYQKVQDSPKKNNNRQAVIDAFEDESWHPFAEIWEGAKKTLPSLTLEQTKTALKEIRTQQPRKLLGSRVLLLRGKGKDLEAQLRQGHDITQAQFVALVDEAKATWARVRPTLQKLKRLLGKTHLEVSPDMMSAAAQTIDREMVALFKLLSRTDDIAI